MGDVTRQFSRSILIFLTLAQGLLATSPVQANRPSIYDWSQAYIGTGHTQATLIFDAILEWPIESSSSPIPSDAVIRSKINSQLAYLIGTFHQGQVASVLGNQVVQIFSKNRIPRAAASLPKIQVRYQYEGTLLLAHAFRPENGFRFHLPIQIEGLYEKQRVNGKSMCTAGSDAGASYYFYHWDPLAEGCNLREGVDFQQIHGDFQRIDNTVRTYPDYPRLRNNQGEIDIRVFFGKSEYGDKIPDPRNHQDWGAKDFSSFTKNLSDQGYTLTPWTTERIRKTAPSGELPVVEEYTKAWGRTQLRITVFFGETGFNYDSAAFHRFWEHALETAPVVIYQGHAGVGKNLHLAKIERKTGRTIQLPSDQYQWLSLAACVTYSYYPAQYFARKRTPADPAGSRNLDILTNGAESYFSNNYLYSTAVIKTLEDWAAGVRVWSYQDLAARGRADVLYGIMGDEDNPTSPPLYP
jgi:hypothetical protein